MPGSEPPPGAGSVIAKDGDDLAVDDRAQPFLLLGRRADLGEQVHVAVVGRHAVEGERAEHRARRLLVHHRPGDDRQPHAAEFLGRLRGPQAGRARLGPHGRQARERDILVLGEVLRIAFERQHVRLDEGAHAQAKILGLGRQREVDHRRCSLVSRATRPSGRRRPRSWRPPCSFPRPRPAAAARRRGRRPGRSARPECRA